MCCKYREETLIQTCVILGVLFQDLGLSTMAYADWQYLLSFSREKDPIAPNVHLRLALLMRKQENLRQSVAELETTSALIAHIQKSSASQSRYSVSLTKKNIFCHLMRARLHLKLESYNLAVKDATVVLKQYPSDELALRVRSMAHTHMGDYEEAIRDLDKYLSINPSDLGSATRLGHLYSISIKTSRSINHFNSLLMLAPTSPALLYGKALACIRAKQLVQARSLLKRCLVSLDGCRFVDAHVRLGEVEEMLTEYDDSLISYHRALSIRQGDAAIYKNIGRVYLSQAKASYCGLAHLERAREEKRMLKEEEDEKNRRLEAGQPVFADQTSGRQKRTRKPRVRTLLDVLRVAHTKSKTHTLEYVTTCLDLAVDALSTSVSLSATDAEAQYLLGLVLIMRAGNRASCYSQPIEQAWQALTCAHSLDPMHASTRVLRALLLLRNNQIAHASEEVRQAQLLEPGHCMALIIRAYFTSQRGEYHDSAKAIQAYELLIQSFKTKPDSGGQTQANQPNAAANQGDDDDENATILLASCLANRALLMWESDRKWLEVSSILADLDHALAIDIDNAAILLLRAEVQRSSGYLDDAVKDYRSVLPLLTASIANAKEEHATAEALAEKQESRHASSNRHAHHQQPHHGTKNENFQFIVKSAPSPFALGESSSSDPTISVSTESTLTPLSPSNAAAASTPAAPASYLLYFQPHATPFRRSAQHHRTGKEPAGQALYHLSPFVPHELVPEVNSACPQKGVSTPSRQTYSSKQNPPQEAAQAVGMHYNMMHIAATPLPRLLQKAAGYASRVLWSLLRKNLRYVIVRARQSYDVQTSRPDRLSFIPLLNSALLRVSSSSGSASFEPLSGIKPTAMRAIYFSIGVLLYLKARRFAESSATEKRDAFHIGPFLFSNEAELAIQYCRLAKPLSQAHLLLGVIFFQRGDLKLAVDEFESAVAANPKVAEYHLNLAVALDRLGKCDKALSCALMAMQLEPTNALAKFNLANVYANMQDNDSAIQVYTSLLHQHSDLFKEALTSKPLFDRSIHNASSGGSNQGSSSVDGNIPEAYSFTRKAAILAMVRPQRASYMAASASKRVDPFHWTESELFDALPLGCPPTLLSSGLLYMAFNNRANCHQRMGHHLKAIHGYTSALRLQPPLGARDTYIQFNRLHSFMQLGDYYEVLADLRTIMRAWNHEVPSVDVAMQPKSPRLENGGEEKVSCGYNVDGVSAASPHAFGKVVDRCCNVYHNEHVLPTPQLDPKVHQHLADVYAFAARVQSALAVVCKDWYQSLMHIHPWFACDVKVPAESPSLFQLTHLQNVRSRSFTEVEKLIQTLRLIGKSEGNANITLCAAALEEALNAQLLGYDSGAAQALMRAAYILPRSPLWAGPELKQRMYAEEARELIASWRAAISARSGGNRDAVKELHFVVSSYPLSLDAQNQRRQQASSPAKGPSIFSSIERRASIQTPRRASVVPSGPAVIPPHAKNITPKDVWGVLAEYPEEIYGLEKLNDSAYFEDVFGVNLDDDPDHNPDTDPMKPHMNLAELTAEKPNASAFDAAVQAFVAEHKERAQRVSTLMNRMGALCFHVGDLDSARSHYEEATRLWPGNVLALANQATLLVAQGRFSRAITTMGGIVHVLKNFRVVAASSSPSCAGMQLTPNEERVVETLSRYGDVLKVSPAFWSLRVGSIQGQLLILGSAIKVDREMVQAVVPPALQQANRRFFDRSLMQYIEHEVYIANSKFREEDSLKKSGASQSKASSWMLTSNAYQGKVNKAHEQLQKTILLQSDGKPVRRPPAILPLRPASALAVLPIDTQASNVVDERMLSMLTQYRMVKEDGNLIEASSEQQGREMGGALFPSAEKCTAGDEIRPTRLSSGQMNLRGVVNEKNVNGRVHANVSEDESEGRKEESRGDEEYEKRRATSSMSVSTRPPSALAKYYNIRRPIWRPATAQNRPPSAAQNSRPSGSELHRTASGLTDTASFSPAPPSRPATASAATALHRRRQYEASR
jgi:tetratricopeptide (TPR) repeat protein